MPCSKAPALQSCTSTPLTPPDISLPIEMPCPLIKSQSVMRTFFVAKPTKNVRITDCDFIRGHGISIGSEMSGGVSGVLVQDCKAGALLHGMQIKGTKDRGGYVRNVTVA